MSRTRETFLPRFLHALMTRSFNTEQLTLPYFYLTYRVNSGSYQRGSKPVGRRGTAWGTQRLSGWPLRVAEGWHFSRLTLCFVDRQICSINCRRD